MTRIDLPSGGWVELRDPETIRARDQERVMRKVAKPDEALPFGFIYDVTNGLKMLMVEKWDVPYLQKPTAIPEDEPWQLGDLTIADNRVLEEAIQPARELLFPKPASPDDEQLDDKASPTTPANA